MYLRAAEVGRAACNFPVMCSRDANTGRWSILAMTSLERGYNLFVKGGEWIASFEPTVMQTYPFSLVAAENGAGGYVMGIDEQCAAIVSDDGDALFDDSGNPSIRLSNVKMLLEADVGNDVQSHHFLTELADNELLRPIEIIVTYEDDTSQTIIDLYTIDEDKLQSLSAEKLGDLAGKGYLVAVHAMLISIYQLNALIRRHNRDAERKPVSKVKLQVRRVAGGAEPGQ